MLVLIHKDSNGQNSIIQKEANIEDKWDKIAKIREKICIINCCAFLLMHWLALELLTLNSELHNAQIHSLDFD